jgi:threonine/homoserine/homoserine lactone efflux protein
MHAILVSLAAFIPVAALLVVTPGLDTALVLRFAAVGSARQAALAALGIAVGCLAWAMLVAFGLGALLSVSRLGYELVQWLGAGYLLWVGLGLLRHPRGEFAAQVPENRKRHSAFATGALTNLLNPKVGIFYVSFLPQFVPSAVPVGSYVLLLGTIHALLGLAWFGCLIAATRPLAFFLQKPGIARRCDRLTGTIFIAFGIGLAMDSRRP